MRYDKAFIPAGAGRTTEGNGPGTRGMQQAVSHPESGKTADRAPSPLEAMAGYDGPAQGFLPLLLDALCRSVQSSQAAVLRLSDTGPDGFIACHPPRPQQHRDGGAWLGRAQQAVQQQPPLDAARLPLLNSTGQRAWAQILLAPMCGSDGQASQAVLCLYIESGEEAAGLAALRQVERAVQVVARYELAQALRQRERDLGGLSQAMQALDAVNREPKFRSAGIALCNQIADTWHASRVAVGFLAGQSVKVRAMSHTEDVIRKMHLVQDLEAAMEECVDQDSEVLVPQPAGATTINAQARRFADKHGPARLCVLPLRLHADVVGALAVEWPTDHEVTPGEVESLRLAANLFTARLHQFHLADRWFGARLATSMRETAALLVGPKHTWAKLVVLAVAAFLCFAFLAKGDDTVDGSFTVQTIRRQIVTAPFEGTLLSVGQGVEVNEPVVGTERTDAQPTVLATMDTSELRVERAAIDAQLADYRAQADAARGEGDLAGVEIALANVRRLDAQARLLDYRIERSTLTSPISGVVIEGDLKQRINGTLDKGEALFEIAPLDAMRAEIRVPASRVGDLRSRLTHPDNPSRGELASASHPGEFIGFTVERIEPEAEVVDGENVFRARVSLDKITDWIRPGVEGEAKVHVEKRSYAYLWTRDAVNWVRMKLWL